jgi:GNAT superfamily N-acetyltransferase
MGKGVRREEICELNKSLFGKDCYYSNINNYTKEIKYITAVKDGIVIGYLIYVEYEDNISSERFGTHPEYRGQGIGKKLLKKIIKMANTKGKKFKTYVRF